MRDSDRQSEFLAAPSPFHGWRGDKPRSLQARWWARACAAVLLCAAAAIALQAQTFTTLINFSGADGEFPVAGFVQGLDGSLYGITTGGGANLSGAVFKIDATGTLTTLYSFCAKSKCTDGAEPYGRLVRATNGDFYGTTSDYGVNQWGTVFKITPTGELTTLYSFCAQSGCTDGALSYAGLVQAADGNLYGTTSLGGTNNSASCYNDDELGCGTVFMITSAGKLTTLYSFCAQTNCTDGARPEGGLVQGTDGNLYGTTAIGGRYDTGTVFKITPTGTLTTLHSFDQSDGAEPWAGLVEATDGNFYGTTELGGANGWGAVFKITPGGRLTTLYSFCAQTNCDDGKLSYAGLIQATDGNFYGATSEGGSDGDGTVFKITPMGTLTTLHNFDGAGGANPFGFLAQATNGRLYGTANLGGTSDFGSVFSLGVGLAPFVETQPTSAPVGESINILGSSLKGATSVTFNGTAATFTVVSPSLIRATVPAGASTGTVQVVTPGGTLSSNVPFRVLP